MQFQKQVISGFVLAGGESRRMGAAKPLLVLAGETLLDRQVRVLSHVCNRVAVVGEPGTAIDAGRDFLPDVIPGRGPLGGIYSGLLHSRSDFNLFAACDMPFVDPRFLSHLVRIALDVRADVTIPEDPRGMLQPTCAIYRRSVLGIIRARLGENSNRTDGYFGRVRTKVVRWREIARAGFTGHMFDNLNRPEDWDEARRRVGDTSFSAAAGGARNG